MNTTDFNDELNNLKEEEKVLLSKHKNKHFSSVTEGENYIKENQLELQRLNAIQKNKRIRIPIDVSKRKAGIFRISKKIKDKYSND